MKLPKFLIGKNKMVNDEEYIVHTREPIFFAEIAKQGLGVILKYDREVPEKLQKRCAEWYFAHQNFKEK